ncbi:MFS transporter [Bradyrhizobium sp. LA6.12]|uniref:MFS transporter n=1 Tax=unclassified Bradyrhizobium TaxID=2631580 RepID=UPI003398A6A2
MLSVLANRTYRHLFAAQVIALIGTGLMTVALGLLAFRIAGENAGAVLGTALAIKMVAYVLVAPVVGGLAGRLPRRTFLVAMDLTRAAVAIALPFIDQVWEVYVLIFVLQSASAAFTPTFQATIPDVLPEERDYTQALSLSRLAYDLESLLSPTLAAALLTLVTFNGLFFGTVIGFFCSAALVVSVTIPQAPATRRRHGFYDDTTRGMRIYLATPRLRGLLALNLAVAAAGSMVFVNTVVLVKGALGGTDGNVALALACFGGGSMAAALLLPRLLDRLPDRRIMLSSAGMLAAVLVVFGSIMTISGGNGGVRYALLPTWALLGIGYSAVMTPSGRLLRRSAGAADRPAVFAAQFALSHLCWLLTYPLAGWLGPAIGLAGTLFALAIVALAGAGLAWRPRSGSGRDQARTRKPASRSSAPGKREAEPRPRVRHRRSPHAAAVIQRASAGMSAIAMKSQVSSSTMTPRGSAKSRRADPAPRKPWCVLPMPSGS